MEEARLLVIDDDVGICETLSDIFQEKGYYVNSVNTGQGALDIESQMAFDAALIDISLPDMEGITLLRELTKNYPETACIIITGHASLKNAIAALKDGAKGYFVKPLVIEEVVQRVAELLDRQRLQREYDQAVKSLRESEAQYQDLYNNAPDMFLSVDAKAAKIIQCNHTFVKVIGYPERDIIGRSVLEMYHPDCMEEAKRSFKLFMATGEVQDWELQLRRNDGTRVDVSLNASAVRDGQGRILYSRSVLRDITKRRQMEDVLLQKNQMQTILNKILSTSIKSFNLNEILNSVLEQIINIPLLKVQAGVIAMVKDEPDVLFIKSQYKLPKELLTICNRIPFGKCICGQAAATKKIQFACSLDACHEVKCDSIPPHGHYCIPLISSGKVLGVLNLYLRKEHLRKKEEEDYLLAIADVLAGVIERKRAENALKKRNQEIQSLNINLEKRVQEELQKSREKDSIMIRQSRLAAMGEMIGNIAHQWRQPLNALNILLYNIKDFYEDKNVSAEELNKLFSKGGMLISEMSMTIDDFRKFFKPDKKKMRFNLNKTVKYSLSLFDASFRYHHISVKVKEKDEAFIVGFPNEYSQVIINVLSNARDAIMEKGISGEIEIEIYSENNFAAVRINDNGGGVPENILERIFDPYYTTKEEGKGTGVGLYMCKMIIEEHMKGHIYVKNTNHGAEFKIVTPVARKNKCTDSKLFGADGVKGLEPTTTS
jgi:PAS domain S-box-containing protein